MAVKMLNDEILILANDTNEINILQDSFQKKNKSLISPMN